MLRNKVRLATAATVVPCLVVLCLLLTLGAAPTAKAQTVRPPCPGGNVYIQNGVWSCTAPAAGHAGVYVAAGAAAAAVATVMLIRHYHHHHYDKVSAIAPTPAPAPTACSDAEAKSNRCWWSTGR